MSKKVSKNIGIKRSKKTQSRKTLTKGHSNKNDRIEERIIKRVKYQTKANKRIDVVSLTIEDIMKQCKEKVDDLLIFHYYLIFIKKMIEGNILKDYELKYDVVQKSKLIKSINLSIKNIPYLDEDIAHMEGARVAECIEELALSMHDAIVGTSQIEKWVYAMIMRTGEKLPPEYRGLTGSKQEIFNRVLTFTAVDYMAKKIFDIKELEKEVIDNEPCKG